jgi:hypothetical protein
MNRQDTLKTQMAKGDFFSYFAALFNFQDEYTSFGFGRS